MSQPKQPTPTSGNPELRDYLLIPVLRNKPAKKTRTATLRESFDLGAEYAKQIGGEVGVFLYVGFTHKDGGVVPVPLAPSSVSP